MASATRQAAVVHFLAPSNRNNATGSPNERAVKQRIP